MSPRRVFPDVPPSALRNVATTARVERVWQRLEADLEGGRARAAWRLQSLAWAPAAFAIVFGSGIFVGAHWFPSDPSEVAAIARESNPPAGPAFQRDSSLTDRERMPPAPDAQRQPRRKRAPQPPLVRVPESPVLPNVSEVTPEVPIVRQATAPEWYRLWNEDDVLGAREAIERGGGFGRAVDAATPDQLMAMADIARSSHETAFAMAALRRVVEQYPGDPNAPYAALTLGNMLEKAGDRAGAAKAYEVSRSLSPKGDLAEDTLAQQIDAALEHGDLDQARQLLDQYAKDFPNGSRLPELRSAVEQAEGVAAAEAAAASERGGSERRSGDSASAAPTATPPASAR